MGLGVLVPIGGFILVVVFIIAFFVGTGVLVLLLAKNALYGLLGTILVRFVGTKFMKKKGMAKSN